jgi:hypothetical protein
VALALAAAGADIAAVGRSSPDETATSRRGHGAAVPCRVGRSVDHRAGQPHR